jgi:hypothetical protein
VNRVTAFLEKHEPEVRELLKESIDLRVGKKAGTPQAYASWAIRAAPLYAEAQNAILEGNQEWRDILTDEQKKLHDSDLTQMRSNFQNVDRLLEGWKDGKGNAMLAQTGRNIQSGGTTTQQGRVSDPQAPVERRQVEDNWLAYVNKFIQTYKLDDKQAISAKDKIYKDIRDEVVKYREKKKEEFAALDAEVLAPKPKLKPAEISQRRQELEKPIQEKFVLLDSRLRQLVDRKQIADANPDDIRQLEAWFKMLSGQGGTKTEVKPVTKSPVAADANGKAASPSPAAPPAKPASPPTTQNAAASPSSKP